MGTDYTPLFISEILATISGHFDRHNTDHATSAYQFLGLQHNLEVLMADLKTALTDLDAFMIEVKAHFTELQNAVTDLQGQLAGTNPDPAVQTVADRIEQAITDARATINAAPPVPTPPN